ncbi:MAG: hypothetical protein M3133_10390, partial [Actinomycetota bacterium]|nr:hypothetical protein [Actinomycetota bacterium]
MNRAGHAERAVDEGAASSLRRRPHSPEAGWIVAVEARLGGWRLPAAIFVAVLFAGQLAVGMQASAIAPINGDEPFYV